MASPPAPRLRPRIRVTRGDEILLGPGKADLLDAVGRRGSLRHASREMGMSYMRAWSLVRTMNRAFREPLVAARRGGAGHGGAALTPTGTRVLALYRAMESDSLEAMAADWKRLSRLLKR